MASDELLRLTGASTGVSRETVTASAAGGGGWKFIGPNRSVTLEFTYGGLFDRTTGDENILPTVAIADDASGTNALTVYTGSAVTVNSRGVSSAATPNEALGMAVAPVRVVVTTTATKQYLRASWTTAGTTPSVAGAVARIIGNIGADASLVGSGS
jgi:hypothetical protein